MRLLIDENVPDDVALVFRARCHEVILVREVFAPGTKDPVIAALGNSWEAIVVSWDRDFKALVPRAPEGTRQLFRKLGRITFYCNYPKGAPRLGVVFDVIDFEYAQAQQRSDKRVLIEIGDNYIRLLR